MKISLIYLMLLFSMGFLLFSCSNRVKIQETSKVFSITHDYKPNRVLLINQNENIFCIAYFKNTDKRIEITNLRDQDKKVIMLPENVLGQHLLSNNPDTVFIYDNIYGEIHLLTKDGYVRTLNLLSICGLRNFRLYPPSQIYNNAFYVSGYDYCLDSNSNSLIESETQILKQIMQNERVFVFKNIFTDSLQITQMLNKFVCDEIVKDSDYVGTDFLKIRILRNHFICFHANSNVLYVFNSQDGKLEEKIELFSNYASLKVPLLRLYRSDKEKELFLEQRQEANFLNGIIYNVTYDEFREIYYVTTLLPNENFHYLNNLTFERDWSLIVLSSDFKELGEFYFKKDEFDFKTIHPIKEGVLIEKKHDKIENRKTEFVVFEVIK
ncbi:MAG TPA: hypothetical protein PLZ52_10375 [Bacteroidales bacterium]|nr:hypothetical protein [Bacteroidales bacterium]